MDDTRTMVCERCKASVPISKIKYAKKGDDSYLPLCFECIQKGQKYPTEKKPRESKMTKEKYRCMRCKYNFKHETGSERNLKCPFCGQKDQVVQDNYDASSILKEV